MKLIEERIDRACPESEIYNELLSLDDANILELGCGAAELTRAIVSEGRGRRITALDVDEIQIRKNFEIQDLPGVTFKLAGAEAIPADDGAFDIALMFKSLHHVPVDLMDQALREIHRVLKPGGTAYISEPLFLGELNEITRLFHDEQRVRREAFQAMQRAVEAKLFTPADEVFFLQPRSFESFAAFEEKVINVSYNDNRLSEELHREVKERFLRHLTADGAHFRCPMRVNLLLDS